MAQALPSTEVRWAAPEDLPAALRCYERNGYAGGFRPGDRVLVAERSGEVVGVVRLVDEHGRRLLRGMFLDEAERGRGLGRRMLERLREALEERACWLICKAHLTRFYGHVGFCAVPEVDVPEPLLDRAARYARDHGPQVVMRRWGATRGA